LTVLIPTVWPASGPLSSAIPYNPPLFHPDDATEPPDESIALQPPEGGLRIWCNKVPEPKVSKNRVHIDINLPDKEEMVRLQRLGARVLQEIRDAEGRIRWTIMADPEENEFCAFLPQT
jgi:hypothetical protein